MTGAEQRLVRLVELTEAAVYADMMRAAPASWACREERSPAGWRLLAPPFRHPPAIHRGPPSPDTTLRISEVTNRDAALCTGVTAS